MGARAGHGATRMVGRGMAGLAVLAWLLLLAGPARAGTWVQVSCVNPNGSAATSEGWSAATSGPFAAGDFATTNCGPGSPMVAAQNVVLYGTPPSVGSIEALIYTPPAGSTLAGGSLDVGLEAYGYGTSNAPAFSVAGVRSPQSNVVGVVACPGQGCSGNTFGPAVVSLPTGQGGTVTVPVGCAALTQASNPCSQSNNASVYARARVYAADLSLSTNAYPQATGFGGSALQRNASGTAGLVFTASDPVGSGTNAPNGPGIYGVGVQIDGRTVYGATPNANGGACVPVGGGGGQPLMFDSQQPCPPAETIDAPVPTRGLPDGRHRLTVTVTDAAGAAATVLDRYISTYNPQVTPAPHGPRRVRARFVLSWRWSGRHTTLLRAGVRGLPANAAVSVRCSGRGCRPRTIHARGAKAVTRVLRNLGGRSFSAGDRVYITVTAPRRHAEKIVLRIRDGQIPAARLLPG